MKMMHYNNIMAENLIIWMLLLIQLWEIQPLYKKYIVIRKTLFKWSKNRIIIYKYTIIKTIHIQWHSIENNKKSGCHQCMYKLVYYNINRWTYYYNYLNIMLTILYKYHVTTYILKNRLVKIYYQCLEKNQPIITFSWYVMSNHPIFTVNNTEDHQPTKLCLYLMLVKNKKNIINISYI